MNIPKKKILIVGGAGFIGHNLGIKLRDLQYEVTIVDSLAINNLYSIDKDVDYIKFPELAREIINERLSLIKSNKINFIIEDARNYHAISLIIEKTNPDFLIHLAAVSHSNKSNKTPHETFDHSLRTLENVLDALKKRSCHLIYLSSSMVYGNFKTDKVDESTECDPIGIYGALKLSGEKIIKAYNQVFGLKYTVVRPSALYGERCISRRVGQIFIESALNKDQIYIDGDGSDMLDFTYIKDFIGGIVSIIENKKSENQTFNLTFGQSRKISNLIEILKGYFPNIIVKNKQRDKFMPKRGTLSIEKAKNFLNYNPIWPIEKGYTQYIEWYKSFFKIKFKF